MNYAPKGVCAKEFQIEVEDGKIQGIDIMGGCPGNLLGLKTLLTGMEVDEAIEKLEGIPCGGRPTSCPDQIAQALKTVEG
ncbi:MAG: TIGR03905 family TSCPD domain-containing protein [Eubacteriales bacterium]